MQQGKYSSQVLGGSEQKKPNSGKYSNHALGIPDENLGTSQGGQDVKMGFVDRVADTFTGASRTTLETDSARETRKALNDVDGGFTVQTGMATTMNPQAQIDIIKEHIPDAKFRQDEHQNTFITLPNGEETILNKPGFSNEDAVQTISQVAAYIPATKIAGIVTSVFGKVGVAALTSLLTNLGLQKTSQEFGSKQPIDKTEAGVAAVAGGAAEGVMPAFQGIRNANRARRYKMDADDFAASRQDALEAKEAVDGLSEISPAGEKVGLIQPQQTLSPNQIGQAKSIIETPQGGRVGRDVLIKQNEQINNAADNVLNSIASPESVEQAATKTQKVAQDLIDDAKAAREDAASPLYEKAFNSFEGTVPIKGVRNLIVSIRKEAANDGQLKATMNKTLKLLKGSTKEVEGKMVTTGPTLKQLHNAKIEIGDIIDGTGGRPLSNTIKRELTRVQQKLTEVLKEASPDYKNAMKTFEEMSPAVDELVNSRVGKIANKAELKNLSELIFDPQEMNLSILKKTKNKIRAKDPQAWDEVVRLSIEKRIGKIRSEVGLQGVPNRPAQLERAIFGNDNQAKILLESVNPTVKRNLIYLRTVLNRAKTSRPGGSDANMKTAARESRSVKRLLGAIFSPIETMKNFGREGAQEAVDAKIANMLFMTDFIPKFKKFQKLPSDSPASTRALAQLLDDVKLVESDSR